MRIFRTLRQMNVPQTVAKRPHPVTQLPEVSKHLAFGESNLDQVLQAKEPALSQVLSVDSTATVFQAISKMQQNHVGSLCVVQGNEYIGLITERDYATKVALRGLDSRKTPVHKIMSGFRALPADTMVSEALKLMTFSRYRFVPVLRTDLDESKSLKTTIQEMAKKLVGDNQSHVSEQSEHIPAVGAIPVEQVIGIISLGDVIRTVLSEMIDTTHFMSSYIHHDCYVKPTELASTTQSENKQQYAS